MLLSLLGCWHRTGSCTKAKQHGLGQITVIPKRKQCPEASACAGGAQVSHQREASEESTLHPDQPSTGPLAPHARWPSGVGRQTACSSRHTAHSRQTDSLQQQQQACPCTEVPLALMQPAAAPPLLAISLLLNVYFCSFFCISDQDVNYALPQKEGGEQVLNRVEDVPEVNMPAERLETLFEAAGCHRLIKEAL